MYVYDIKVKPFSTVLVLWHGIQPLKHNYKTTIDYLTQFCYASSLDPVAEIGYLPPFSEKVGKYQLLYVGIIDDLAKGLFVSSRPLTVLADFYRCC